MITQLLAGLSAFGQVAAPTKPDSLLRVTDASCKWVKLRWAKGNGQYHLVVLTEYMAADASPSQGVSVFPSSYYMAGGYTQSGGFAVYGDTGRVATVQNLVKGRQYRALVYAYNLDANGTPAYQLSRVPDTLRFTTPNCPDVTPLLRATRLRATQLDCSTLRLTVHPGSGQGRMFVMRKSSPATAGTSAGNTSVENESFYPPSNLYARGLPNQSECYPVYAGSDSTVIVYGLAPDQIYKVAVYEYNTVPGPTGYPDGSTPFYQQTFAPYLWPATVACVGGEPGKSPYDDKQHQTSNATIIPGTLTATSVQLSWHPSMTPAHVEFVNGSAQVVPASHRVQDGDGNYVVIRNPLNFNAITLPLQNTVPSVVSTVYGQGSPVRPGEALSYSVKLTQQWNDTTATITGLQPSSAYIVDVFTFRYPDAGGTTPYTYFLSLPQASLRFFTPSAPTPLPVQLVGFTATRSGGDALLQWTTASEINNQGFGIERSLDGQTWQLLSFVPGHGSTQQQQQYRYADSFADAAYYRLAQKDNSQAITYSPVRYVTGGKLTARLGLYPNPASGLVTITAGELDHEIELRTTLGTVVRRFAAGSTEFDVSGLAPGIYLVRQGNHAGRLTVQ